jgi:hypothetical protein
MHVNSLSFTSFLPRTFIAAVVALAAVTPLASQAQEKIEFPAASQLSTVKQRVGLTDVEVTYSRPNKNDRPITAGSCHSTKCGAPERIHRRRSSSATR